MRPVRLVLSTAYKQLTTPKSLSGTFSEWSFWSWNVTFRSEFGMYFTSPSRTALCERRRTPAPPQNERIIHMIEQIFTGVLGFFNDLIYTGSAAAEGFVGTGSAAAEGVYGVVTGSLGDIAGSL